MPPPAEPAWPPPCAASIAITPSSTLEDCGAIGRLGFAGSAEPLRAGADPAAPIGSSPRRPQLQLACAGPRWKSIAGTGSRNRLLLREHADHPRRSRGRRSRRRADHRRRRGRRGVRLEPRRDAHEHPVSRAGRLDGPRSLPDGGLRLGDARARRLRAEPQHAASVPRTIRSTIPIRRSRPRCSTPSAAARSCMRGTSRACTRRTSACARSMVSPTTGRSTTRQLAPFYAENDRMMGVAGLAGDPAYPPKQVPLPPVPLGKLGETIARGFNSLGWHWWPSDSAIATRAYEGRAPCINLGPCITGCAQGAKASTDVTYWPAACAAACASRRAVGCARSRSRRTAARTARSTTTRRARCASSGPRSSCSRATASGRRACCSTRAPPAFPDGLANRSGLVGRNLMFHPYGMVVGGFPERLDGYKGPTGCGLMSQEFYETDLSRGFVRGYSFELLRGMGPVSTALWGMSAGRLPWGDGHHEAYADVFARTAGVLAICEDLPELAQLRDARSRAHRRQRHSGAAHPVSTERELAAHARARRGAREAGARGGRRRVDARRVAAARRGLAPDGDRAHGQRSGALRRERVGPLPRRPQSVHHRRQRVRDGRGGEPHLHDPGLRALRRRQAPEATSRTGSIERARGERQHERCRRDDRLSRRRAARARVCPRSADSAQRRRTPAGRGRARRRGAHRARRAARSRLADDAGGRASRRSTSSRGAAAPPTSRRSPDPTGWPR